MKQKLDRPCKECPFRRESAPGWLGNSTPEEFIGDTIRDTRMPCHMTVDYNDPEWANKLEDVEACAGAGVFFANRIQLSRDPERRRYARDTDEVFANKKEFIDHHTPNGFVWVLHSAYPDGRWRGEEKCVADDGGHVLRFATHDDALNECPEHFTPWRVRQIGGTLVFPRVGDPKALDDHT